MARNREPRSSYARKGKVPYRYSDTLREWQRTVRKAGTSDTEQARKLAEEHARSFGYSLFV